MQNSSSVSITKPQGIWAGVMLLLLYCIDRLAKQYVFSQPEVASQLFDSRALRIELHVNHGAIFGLQAGQVTNTVLVFFSVVLLAFACWFIVIFIQSKKLYAASGWALVFIGGVSNLWDRITLGFVIDWLVMPWGAVINLADVFIIMGVLLISFELFKQRH